MENRNFYNQILTEHNLHPEHKHDLADANLVLEGVNPSCGDDIVLKLKVEDGVITDGAFVGDGCAISQASADIMLDLIIGEKKEDALHLAELFLKMIKDSITEEEMEELDEAAALKNSAIAEELALPPVKIHCSILAEDAIKAAVNDYKARHGATAVAAV